MAKLPYTELEDCDTLLALSPMADMTDSPFCQIVREIGGVDLVFREMVSSEAIVRDNEKTLSMVDLVDEERPIVQQIFGADPLTMAKAAEVVVDRVNPSGIDINMGCPVYKLTSNFNGAALMKEPERSAAIVREMKAAIGDTPLSVKIRLGWDDPDTFKTFIPVVEEAGAQMVTIHGRTKAQAYSGKSDWERIRQAKEVASGPLIANGDIHAWSDVDKALEVTKADGVLIARGALGNPWFFDQYQRQDGTISLRDRVKVIKRHVQLHVDKYGERGIVTFRKHLSWYLKSNKMGQELHGIKEWRGKFVRVSSLDELFGLLDGFLEAYE